MRKIKIIEKGTIAKNAVVFFFMYYYEMLDYVCFEECIGKIIQKTENDCKKSIKMQQKIVQNRKYEL